MTCIGVVPHKNTDKEKEYKLAISQTIMHTRSIKISFAKRFWGPTSKVSDPAGLWWGPVIDISNKFLGETEKPEYS